ncbi:MAG TPA: glycosyltransferase family 4 protein [Pyrinomonadaceae bacterium]|jgi:glycosyltransferase involved in cell wall biosynthesis|nr:glycosyltransferase family 4 protein [Pyrinomonadaceae bacterium]
MKVLFVSPSFYPARHYGGPTAINYSFCNTLATNDDVELKVLATDADGPGKRIDFKRDQTQTGYPIKYCRVMFPPDIAPMLLLRLPGAIQWADIVHLNSVYSFTTLPALVLCRLLNKPLVWSTMGALQRWDGSTRSRVKRLWEWACNQLARPARVALHVTSEQEKLESEEKIPNADAIVLKNGIDLPSVSYEKEHGTRLSLLYIGRLHPIKGIDNLLKALALVATPVELSICGFGPTAYEEDLQSLVHQLKLAERVTFHGRVDGESKEQHFRRAHVCVAPSHKEAFCTVVLESLARGVPVIASTGTPWRAVEDVGCGLCVDNSPAELARAIDEIATMPLADMGARGRRWMADEFSWQKVTDEMLAHYRGFLQNEPRPRKQTIEAASS